MAKLKKFMVEYARVPNTLLNDETISLKAKGLFAYIESKPDDWDFSVERIARALREGASAIGDGIKELEKAGYLLRQRYQDEHGHWLVQYILTDKILSPENPTQENPTIGKPPNITKKEFTKKDNTNNTTNVVLGEPPEKVTSEGNIIKTFGDPDIDYLLGYWEQTVGYALTAKMKTNRWALKNLLKKYSLVQMRQLIDGVALTAEDKYAPRIADFTDLQRKLNELLLWGKKRSSGIIKI